MLVVGALELRNKIPDSRTVDLVPHVRCMRCMTSQMKVLASLLALSAAQPAVAFAPSQSALSRHSSRSAAVSTSSAFLQNTARALCSQQQPARSSLVMSATAEAALTTPHGGKLVDLMLVSEADRKVSFAQ